MKGHFFSSVVLVCLSVTACSRPHAPGSALDAPPRPAAATQNGPRDLAKQDLDKLQGTWRIESSFWNGVREPAAARSVTIVFQDNKFICIDKDGERLENTIQLMPDHNPKAIDCWSKGQGEAAPGIYALEGDTFTWCSAGGNNKVRPTSFASEPGSKQSLLILRRKS